MKGKTQGATHLGIVHPLRGMTAKGSAGKIQASKESFNNSYSLRPILLFANTDVSITKICLDTSTLAKSIMGRREYEFSQNTTKGLVNTTPN
jgi:hypothetical protein